jgi:hypothetical protein
VVVVEGKREGGEGPSLVMRVRPSHENGDHNENDRHFRLLFVDRRDFLYIGSDRFTL